MQRIEAHSDQQPDTQPGHEPKPRDYKVHQNTAIFITSACAGGGETQGLELKHERRFAFINRIRAIYATRVLPRLVPDKCFLITNMFDFHFCSTVIKA